MSGIIHSVVFLPVYQEVSLSRSDPSMPVTPFLLIKAPGLLDS